MSAWLDELERLIDEYGAACCVHFRVTALEPRNSSHKAEKDAARAALLAHAAQADRDAPVGLPEPKEVPMPSPDGWLAFRTLDGTKWIGIHEPTTFDNRDPLIRASRVRQYGDAREAAGYARGRAEKQSKAPEQCRWFQAGPDSDTWQTGCGSYFTINDGTPSENNMAHCAYCGRHLVEYSWEEEQKGGE